MGVFYDYCRKAAENWAHEVNTHFRALLVRWTSVQRGPERSVDHMAAKQKSRRRDATSGPGVEIFVETW